MTPSPVRILYAVAVGPFEIRRIDYAAGLRQPPHTHDASSVTLVLAGEIHETSGRLEEWGSALSVVVKPAGVRHADIVGARGARTLQVAFGRRGADELREGGCEPERWCWLHGGPGVASLLQLGRAIQQDPSSRSGLEDLVLEALSSIRGHSEEGKGGPPGWIARVREAVDDDPFGERSVRDLARLAGTHPVSLSRAFRREFGVTITEYRRTVRLRRAARIVTEGDGSLSRAAHAAGYADHPHMCREFQLMAGLSPSALRRIADEG